MRQCYLPSLGFDILILLASLSYCLFVLFFRKSLIVEPISYNKPFTSDSLLLGLQGTTMPSSFSSFKYMYSSSYCCFRKSSATSQCMWFPGLKYSKCSRRTVPIAAEHHGTHAVSSMLLITLQSIVILNLPNKKVSLFSPWFSCYDSSFPL